METAIAQAVARVITDMHDNFGEELTIDDMARTARFSKFHFTRAFTDMTGVSPGRSRPFQDRGLAAELRCGGGVLPC